MQSAQQHNKRGESIVEVVMSIAIITIGIIGVASAIPYARRFSLTQIRQGQAYALAEAALAQKTGLTYHALDSGTIEDEIALSDNELFTQTVVVAHVDENRSSSAEETGLKQISATIEWKSLYGNANQQITLSSLISDHE